MARTLIKICGVTRVVDAEQIVALGADVIGLNFVTGSPREITAAAAREIADAVGNQVELWGLFVNAAPARVREVLAIARLTTLQFNGDETAEQCSAFGLPWVKAIHMREAVDFPAAEKSNAGARMLLLDTFAAGQRGGTGKRFDWTLWPLHSDLPLMLAGGLDPDNVREAVLRLRPAGVDVAGGVEGAVKGVKDMGRCGAFIASVRATERELTDDVETVRR